MKLLVAIVCLLISASSFAKDEWVAYSAQWQAFAPNAGGQRAFSLRRANDEAEISLFRNEYLMTGGDAVMGLTYDWRYPVCGLRCPVQAFIQVGGGISTGGPIIEITWSTIVLWVARIDFTTQLFAARDRVISWSTPAWIGVSIPSPY